MPTVLSFASFGVVLGIEGDRLLKRVAGALASVARQGETAARVGGEEFALLLSGAAGEDAYAAAERVRAAVAAVQFHPSHGAVTTITERRGIGKRSVAEGPDDHGPNGPGPRARAGREWLRQLREEEQCAAGRWKDWIGTSASSSWSAIPRASDVWRSRDPGR
ncbi:MAG TPA: diguanylate cyclase [Gemmatimonadota bacterium]|nr:diguanylate cyclase [Gemmatimonadota bacterium]